MLLFPLEKDQLYKVSNRQTDRQTCNTSPVDGCVFSVTTDNVPNEEQQLRGKRKFGAPFWRPYLQQIRAAAHVATVHYALIHYQPAGSKCKTSKSLGRLNQNSSSYWNNKQFVLPLLVLLFILTRGILPRVLSSSYNQNFVSRLQCQAWNNFNNASSEM